MKIISIIIIIIVTISFATLVSYTTLLDVHISWLREPIFCSVGHGRGPSKDMDHGWSTSVSLKVHPRTASSTAGNLSEMQILRSRPKPTESETLWVGPSNLWLNKFSRGFHCSLKLKNQSSILTWTKAGLSASNLGVVFLLSSGSWDQCEKPGRILWKSFCFRDKMKRGIHSISHLYVLCSPFSHACWQQFHAEFQAYWATLI